MSRLNVSGALSKEAFGDVVKKATQGLGDLAPDIVQTVYHQRVMSL
jgi:hypothetical protein